MLEKIMAERLINQLEDTLTSFAKQRRRAWISEYNGTPPTGELSLDMTIFLDDESKLVCRLSIEKITQTDREDVLAK
jgi:hypothetical protein